MTDAGKPTAFFGPLGSHTEIALQEHLAPKTCLPCHSIAEVFLKLSSGSAAAGFVPIENMLQGPVAETLDLLLEYKNQVHIAASYVSDIVHCLGVLPGSGESLSGIRQVYSHEQALRQCAKFLLRSLPQAELCPAASTGSAAALVKEKDLSEAAVIAAESTLKAHGFEVAARDISDIPGNRTRFVLLRPGPVSATQGSRAADGGGSTTSIVIDPGRDRQGLLFEILEVISVRHRINLSSIHSRPDARGGFVFHLDLEGSLADEKLNLCLQALRQYCADTTGQTAEIIVCGSYPKSSFNKPHFQRVGIIGGGGTMGRWFDSFFRQAELEVLINEKDGGVNVEELCRLSDVVLLSVPMSTAPEAAAALCRHLRPGQLVVENCSIKSSLLPLLLRICPPEVEVLGIHTMFGGDTPSLRGENVIVTRTERSGSKARSFEDLLYKFGAKLTHAGAADHDRHVAFMQSLVHFCALCMADVMQSSFESAQSLGPFSTPNSRAILQVISRVLRQTDSLLTDMQVLNEEYPAIRSVFIDKAAELARALENGDLQRVHRTVEAARAFLK